MESSMVDELFLFWFWLTFMLSSSLLAGGIMAFADWCLRVYHKRQIRQLRQQYRCAIPNRALPRFPARLY